MPVRAIICLLLTVALLVPVAAEAGEVRGKITLRSEMPARKVGSKRVKLGYSKSELPDPNDQGGLPPGAKVDELANVVVYVEARPGTLKATPQTDPNKCPSMSQRNKDFEPHVLAVVRGSKVRFLNYDQIYHHIYSASQPGEFVIKRYKGKQATQTFDEPTVVEIFCGLHPRMNAYILVTENDFFRQPDAAGLYRIPNLPPGEYVIKAWHPRLKTVEKKITVPESGPVTADMVL